MGPSRRYAGTAPVILQFTSFLLPRLFTSPIIKKFMKAKKKKRWQVYILETNKGTLYTGITNDLAHRIAVHKKGKGALFTRLCGVKKLLYSVNRPNRSSASKREAEIKKWPRKKKLELIKQYINSRQPKNRGKTA